MNGGNLTKYLKFEKGARQGDPIPNHAYLFILVLEIVFLLFIKKNKNALKYTCGIKNVNESLKIISLECFWM